MISDGPFGLAQAWPLDQGARRFDLGLLINCFLTDALQPQAIGALANHHAGLWDCDLKDQSLIWSGGVYDLFGLQRDLPVTRDQAVAHYSEDSRAKLERFRSAAIQDHLGSRSTSRSVPLPSAKCAECASSPFRSARRGSRRAFAD